MRKRLYYIDLNRFYVIQGENIHDTCYVITEGDIIDAIELARGDKDDNISITINEASLIASTHYSKDRVTDLVI